jgi:hypothetical protein
MSWRRVIDSTAFLLAVGVAVWIRYGLESSWNLAIGCAVIVFVLTPFIVSRVLGTYILRRMERQLTDRRDRK